MGCLSSATRSVSAEQGCCVPLPGTPVRGAGFEPLLELRTLPADRFAEPDRLGQLSCGVETPHMGAADAEKCGDFVRGQSESVRRG